MKANRLRELLNEGKPSIGTHVLSTWPGVVETIGHSGAFDYVEYVGEYSPFSLEQMDNLGRTIELFPNMSMMMKIEEQGRGFIAQRAIDSGIQNVLFADIRTAADARECVRFVRSECPAHGGVHGAGMRRSVGYLLEGGTQAWRDALKDTVIAIMIEKKTAVEQIDAILDVEGVDMVQFGPTDYSVSIGAAETDPEVEVAHRRVIQAALKAGKHPRVESESLEEAKPYLDMGVKHYCVGWDLSTVFLWCSRQAQSASKLGLRTRASLQRVGYVAAASRD